MSAQARADGRIPTSLVGSYAQPSWLIDRERLRGRFPPRVRATELWRVDPRYLEEAQDDATLLAIGDQERAGLDIITDGEMRRESYSNRFATALDGVDIDMPGTALDRSGHPNPVPRVTGPIARRHPVQVRDLEFLRAHTSKPIKITVPGPFTMSQQAQDDFYGARDALGAAYALAVREEIVDLFAAGADIVQIDEPYMQARPEAARAYGVDVSRRGDRRHRWDDRCPHLLRLRGDHPRSAERVLVPWRAGKDERRPGVDRDGTVGPRTGGARVASRQDDHPRRARPRGLDFDEVETPTTVAERIRRAFPYVPAGRLVAAPDCGMKYLSREGAYGKLEALAEGARLAAS